MRKSDRVRTSPSSSVLSNAPFGLSRTPKKRERERGRRGRERERERERENEKRPHHLGAFKNTSSSSSSNNTITNDKEKEKNKKKTPTKKKKTSQSAAAHLLNLPHLDVLLLVVAHGRHLFCLLFCVYLLKNNVQFFLGGRKRCRPFFLSTTQF